MVKNILILGQGQSGKDQLAAKLNKNYTNISLWFAKHHLTAYMYSRNIKYYPTAQKCYDDRGNYRALWKKQMQLFNKNHNLVDIALANGGIYCGMRSQAEFDLNSHKFDVIVFIKRPGTVADPTLEINFKPDTMLLFNNDGGLEGFDRWIKTNNNVLYTV